MQSKLTLTTKLRSGQTVLDDCFASPPLKLLTLPPQADGVLRAIQMSSSPGLLAGDRVDMDIRLGAGSALDLRTQAFTRVQAMPPHAQARQHTRIRMASGSRLCYLPHPLVLHADAALTQRTDIELDDKCVLVLGEIMICGRVLGGERWRFRHLSSQVRIRRRQALLLSDNIQWHPQRQAQNVLGQMEGFSHQAGLYYVDTAADGAQMRIQANRLYELLAATWQTRAEVLWGVSQAADHALCLRALGHQAEALQALLAQAAAGLRPVPP